MNAAPVWSVYPAATQPCVGGRVPEGAGNCSVILSSLQNISTETQAQSRLAVLCQVSGQGWHPAYGAGPSLPSFGGARRMFALPLFVAPLAPVAGALDTRVNAKQ